MNSKSKKLAVFLVILVTFFVTIQSVSAFKLPKINLGGKDLLQKVLVGGGIVLLIRQFGDELNKFINTILMQKGAAIKQATKVVPIMTFGTGTAVGACQVSGPAEAVSRVKVVLAISQTFAKGHKFKIEVMVPSSSLNPTKLDRVDGVGISAIIDYKL